jgi:hypothetical protein
MSRVELSSDLTPSTQSIGVERLHAREKGSNTKLHFYLNENA